MKIKKLVIEGLFDLDYNLDFYEDVNFLHGINGCGKTTILNILSSIISGKLTNLYKYTFNKIIFFAQSNEKKIILQIKIDPTTNRYHFDIDGTVGVIPHKDHNVESRRIRPQKSSSDMETLISYLRNNEGDYTFNNYRILKKTIIDNFSPIYLPLGRKNIGSNSNTEGTKYIVTNGGSTLVSEISDMDSSLKNAISLVHDRYTRDTYLDNKLLEDLKTQIVTNTFNNAFSTEDILSELLSYNEDNFNSIFPQEFYQTIYDLKLNDAQEAKIFLDIKDIQDKLIIGKNSFIIQENKLTIIDSIKFANYIVALSQIKKNKELVERVIQINRRRAKVKFTINQLLNVVNRFFSDSGKKIFIDHGTLKFKHGKKQKNCDDVTVMSSGEKQILIFFIYAILKVDQKKPGVFMIDEPELSLHLEWQQIFVSSLMEIIPNVQIIFATHSPEIIGDLRNKCIEVRGIEK